MLTPFTKICCACGGEFRLPPKAKRSRCRGCRRIQERSYQGNSYKVKRKPAPLAKRREYSRKYEEKPETRAKRLAYWNSYVALPENDKKYRARVALRTAVRRGKIARLPCEVCGVTRVHGHHDDYSKPFDVRWLCALHHRAHHAAITKQAA